MNKLQEFLQQIILRVGEYELTVLNLALIGAIIIAVWLLRWAVNQGLRGVDENFKISKENKRTIHRFFNTLITVFSVLMIIRALGLPLPQLLSFEVFTINRGEGIKPFAFHVSNLVNVLIIYFFVRVIMWLLDQLLNSYYERDKVDVGAQYAINQVLRYIIYTSAILAAIQALGFNLTLIWGGAAALLVGFGLGLQQTFNDLISGLLLLIERTVEVGDTLDVDGEIGIVERIGIRVSHVRNRADIIILLPNSKLVTSKVINWSSKRENTRFDVAVGTAYGSDTALIKKLLLEIVNHHEKVETYPTPFVLLEDFGASSLDFKVFFWSKELMKAEHIKSDIRFEIDRVFREHKIEVPFPQRDVWIKK